VLLDPTYLATLPRFDMLRFGHGGMMWDYAVKHAERDGFSIVAPVFPSALMAAQVLTREGAARIAAGFIPQHAPVDIQLFNDGYVRGLRILQTVPTLNIEPTGPSTISEPDWPTFDMALPARLKRKSARTRAIWRNTANYAQAWGPLPLLHALLRRDGTATKRLANGSGDT